MARTDLAPSPFRRSGSGDGHKPQSGKKALDLTTLGRVWKYVRTQTAAGRVGVESCVSCPHSLCSHNCLRPLPNGTIPEEAKPTTREMALLPCHLSIPLPHPAHTTSRIHKSCLLHSGCWSLRHLATCHCCEGGVYKDLTVHHICASTCLFIGLPSWDRNSARELTFTYSVARS